jgi:RNase P/RNase MRP subunit p30
MIDTSDFEKAKSSLKRESSPKIVKASEDQFNRNIIEYGKFDILLSPEKGDRKGTLRNIDSGFNEVLARISAKKGISIGIDIRELRSLPKIERAIRLSKIRQNIKLCRKAGVRTALIGVNDIRDAKSFLFSLGASANQVKDGLFLTST